MSRPCLSPAAVMRLSTSPFRAGRYSLSSSAFTSSAFTSSAFTSSAFTSSVLARPCLARWLLGSSTALMISPVVFAMMLLALTVAPQGVRVAWAESALIRDEDLERLLADSDRLAARREWSLAATLLQRVLDEGRDAAMIDPATGVAVPLARAAEQRLARFPPEGLLQYRLLSDGAARTLWQAATDRERSLADIVQRFFFTRLGDDAAWELAGRAFDAGDALSAAVLLERLANLHPDPTPDRASINFQRIIAAAMLGDRLATRRLLDQFAKPASSPAAVNGPGTATGAAKALTIASATATSVDGARRAAEPSAILNAIRQWLDRPPPANPPTGATPANATTPNATVSNPRSLSPATAIVLPASAFPWRDPTLRDHAAAARHLRAASNSAWNVVPIAESFVPLAAWRVGRAAGLLRLSDPELLGHGYDDVLPRTDPGAIGRRWLRARWPSQPLVTVAGLDEPFGELYWTRNDGWSRWDRSGAAAIEWRERWTQRGPTIGGDDATLPSAWRMVAAEEVSLRDPPRKLTAVDAFVWADALRHAITVAEDMVFAIEPRAVAADSPRFAARRQWSWRTRGNELAAHDRLTGELRWRRGAEECLPPDQDADATFLGPIASGDQGLFAPLLGGSTLYIASLSPQDGSTRWLCRVAGEPREGAWPWSAAAIATAGRELYANLGSGIVVAVSQDTGSLRWLARYPRSLARRGPAAAASSPSRGLPAASGQSPPEFPAGWDEDRLAIAGPYLVCVATDADSLRVFDRRTGAVAWESPRDAAGASPASQLIGATEHLVIVAGPQVLRGYELATGRLLWEHDADRLAGRPALLGTDDGESVVVAPSLAEGPARVGQAIGVDDPLSGSGLQVELQLRDAASGALLRRWPLAAPTRLPLDVVPMESDVLLADRAGLFRLSPAVAPASGAGWVSLVRLTVPDGAAARGPSGSPLPGSPLPGALPPIEPAAPATPSAPEAPAAPAASANPATPTNPATPSAPGAPAAPAVPGAPVAAGAWRVLLSDLARGVVVECDRDGRERWSFAGTRFPGLCCGWNDSRRWVLDHDECRLVELNEAGRSVAVWAGLPGRPASLRALADGAAIAAFPELGVVGVVERTGVWRWTFRCLGRPVDAVLDRQERVWVALGADTRITAFDRAGQPIQQLDLPARPRSVQWLEAAMPMDAGLAYLLPDLGQFFRVALPRERSGDGAAPLPQLVQAGGRNARFAHWLADGGLLFADAVGVRCLDRAGRLVWKRDGDVAGGIAVIGDRVE